MQNEEAVAQAPSAPGMTFERAKEIVGKMIRVVYAAYGIPGDAPDLAFLEGLSLSEMVEANRLLKSHDGNPRVEGEKTIRTIHLHCDDRLAAAMYAMLHFPAHDPQDPDPILSMEVRGKLHILVQVIGEVPEEDDDGR